MSPAPPEPTSAERQVGQGWEGSGCPVVVRGTTAGYRQALVAVVEGRASGSGPGPAARWEGEKGAQEEAGVEVFVEVGCAAGVTLGRVVAAWEKVRGRTGGGGGPGGGGTRRLVAVGLDGSYGELAGARRRWEEGGEARERRQEKRRGRDGADDNTSPPPAVEFCVAKVQPEGGRGGARVGDGECLRSLAPLAEALAGHGLSLRDVTVLGIDVGGTEGAARVMAMCTDLRRVTRPAVTVVKSLGLRKAQLAMAAGEDEMERLELRRQEQP